MSTSPKSHAALAVEAVYAIANDPENWDLLLAALDNAPTPDEQRQQELAELVAGSARIAERNVTADSAPEIRTAVIVVSRSGRHVASSSAVTDRMPALLGFDASGALDAHAAAVLREGRQRMEASTAQVILRFDQAADDDPVFVYAVPLSELDPVLAKDLVLPPGEEAGALALIIPSQIGLDSFWTSLRESFGLTQAETRLASLLKDGLSLKEAASELDLSINTVRNQLASVFAKLGLNRQSDLVRSLTQLAALARNVTTPSSTVAGVAEAPPLQMFRLPDGRKFGWREYGVADGRPALLFNAGFGGSLLPDSTGLIARRRGLRLVVPERAGQGHSDPDPAFCFESSARDVTALCDHIGIDRFPMAGLTSGTRFALAAAAQLGNRVSRILLASPRVPMKRDRTGPTGPMEQFARRVSSNLWLLEPVYAIMRMKLSRPLVSRLMHASATEPSDVAYLRSHPEMVDLFVAMLRESMAVTSKGTTDEMKLLRLSGGPDLTPIHAPVAVWHGAGDTYATTKEVLDYLDGVNTDLRVFDDIGNFLVHKHWGEIIAWLASSNEPEA